MREHPILFSAPMVRAILAGTKTQTRRVVKPQPTHFNPAGTPRRVVPTGGPSDVIRCPYGQPGDRLWVREAWRVEGRHTDSYSPECIGANRTHFGRIDYEASIVWNKSMYGKLRPGMHMPRWASRITLEITGVRVERLQDISEADAVAEGVWRTVSGYYSYGDEYNPNYLMARDAFRGLWESISGHGSWGENPWVWVIDFRRVGQEGGAA